MKINLRINKRLNFFMIIYQFLKNQNDFSELNLKNFNLLKKEDTKIIKQLLRGDKSYLEIMIQNPSFKQFYKLNKNVWNKYWDENKDKLVSIKSLIEEKILNYPFDIFKKVEKFFGKQIPKEIDFWIFMGNEKDIGTGNAFRKKYISLFPRNFKNYSSWKLDKDFAVIIHEIIHLLQNPSCEKKENDEFIAQCFAPRGILINQDQVKLRGVSLEKFKLVKTGFESKKTLKDIELELKNLDESYSKKETQIKFLGGKNEKDKTSNRL